MKIVEEIAVTLPHLTKVFQVDYIRSKTTTTEVVNQEGDLFNILLKILMITRRGIPFMIDNSILECNL